MCIGTLKLRWNHDFLRAGNWFGLRIINIYKSNDFLFFNK